MSLSRHVVAILVAMNSATAAAQCDSLRQFPFGDTCYTYAQPWPTFTTECFNFTTGAGSVQFVYSYFASCIGVNVGYVLLTTECEVVDANGTGFFAVPEPGTYAICASLECEPPGGIGYVCPTEWITLPVELVRFTAYPTDAGIVLEWVTATEHNSDRFEVFRMRTEGDRGTLLASLKAAGYSQGALVYRWTDTAPEPGLRLYRLEQVDMDGSRAILRMIQVRWSVPDGRGKLWPFDAAGRRVK